MTDLDKARVWAECTAGLAHLKSEEIQAAVDIIQSLPDQWVDVEKVREVISGQLSFYTSGTVGHYIAEEITRNLESLLTPKLPTLAELIEQGNDPEQYRWMQARLEGSAFDFVIPNPGHVESMLWAKDGTAHIANNSLITPLTGEPKFEWPGSAPDDVAYATGGVLTTRDVVDECRAVRKERALPHPEDVPDPHPGEAWLVNTREGEQREALKAGNRWYVKDGDDVEEWVEEALTPISRLVPETPALPEGMRLADHETYGRVVVSPEADHDDDYKVFLSDPGEIAGAGWGYVNKSELTFLDGDQHA